MPKTDTGNVFVTQVCWEALVLRWVTICRRVNNLTTWQ